MATAVKLKTLAATRETTLHHGETQLEICPFPLESGYSEGRDNRDGGVRARVRAWLIEERGALAVCLT